VETNGDGITKATDAFFPMYFDVVGRFENYEADFTRVLEACGAAAPNKVPHVNKRVSHPPIAWDRETLAAVEARFGEDFENFGYEPLRP